MTELKEHQEVIERCISEKIDSYMSNYSATSIGDYASNAVIRAYIDEVSRLNKRCTRKQKIAYLFRKKKYMTLKDVYALVNKQLTI